MIYYEIYFLITLISNYNFVKVSFISIFISNIKTSNIFENKLQVFERSDWTITVHNDLYYHELKI